MLFAEENCTLAIVYYSLYVSIGAPNVNVIILIQLVKIIVIIISLKKSKYDYYDIWCNQAYHILI